jgi:glucosylceramidase
LPAATGRRGQASAKPVCTSKRSASIRSNVKTFARYIRPGAQRVLCASSLDELEAAAFENDENGLAIIILNRSDEAIPFDLRVAADVAHLESPPHSISTLLLPPNPQEA